MATIVDIGAADGWLVVAFRVDLDLATAPKARSAIAANVGSIDEPLLLDLSGCEIVDSTGLGVLISLLRRAREANQRCAIIGANPAVTRILVVTGLDQLFVVLDAEHFPDVRVL